MTPLLTDSVVILTGASSGLGMQLARGLDAAGASVALAARRGDRLRDQTASMRDAIAIDCDVTDSADRERLFASVDERWGRLDGLVNNAGVSNVTLALKEQVEEFEDVLRTNLVAPFALAQLAAQAMKETGGAIVNIASIAAFRPTARLPAAAYTASKAGLVGLTRELATQWGRYSIRVNAVAPGWFSTEMTSGLFTEDGAPEWLTAGVSLHQRAGKEGELDAAVVYLLSRASSYVTGQTIVVDGGLTAN